MHDLPHEMRRLVLLTMEALMRDLVIILKRLMVMMVGRRLDLMMWVLI